MGASEGDRKITGFIDTVRRAFGGGFFVRYLVVGAIVFVVDVGLFQALNAAHAALWVATSVAYTVGVVVHFILNKYVNFRAFDRTIFAQARTYLALQVPMLLLTTAVVETCSLAFHLTPLVSKAISIAVNLPIGFLSHRYLTFSKGITAAVRRLAARLGDGA